MKTNLRNLAVGFRRAEKAGYRKGMWHGYILGCLVTWLLAGCDPEPLAPAESTLCAEWLTCFQGCMWGDADSPPLASVCANVCESEVGPTLSTNEISVVEGAEDLAQGSWLRLSSAPSQCDQADVDCLAWRRERLEQAVLDFVAAEQTKAALCAPYQENQ